MIGALLGLCAAVCAFVAVPIAADSLVAALEQRPRSRFGRALAALERISGTHPDQ